MKVAKPMLGHFDSLDKSMEEGINLFDNAETYGNPMGEAEAGHGTSAR